MVINARISDLDALNIILAQAGELPVNRTTDLPVNAARAWDTLGETLLAVQSDSSFWHLNTRKNVVLIPDAITSKIQVAANIVSVSEPNLLQDSEDIALRGDFLFDIKHNTYLFDHNITVDTREILPWGELSVQLRWYIQKVAARLYQIRWIQDQAKHNYNQEEELAARALAIGTETREANISILNNPSIAYYNNQYI